MPRSSHRFMLLFSLTNVGIWATGCPVPDPVAENIEANARPTFEQLSIPAEPEWYYDTEHWLDLDNDGIGESPAMSVNGVQSAMPLPPYETPSAFPLWQRLRWLGSYTNGAILAQDGTAPDMDQSMGGICQVPGPSYGKPMTRQECLDEAGSCSDLTIQGRAACIQAGETWQMSLAYQDAFQPDGDYLEEPLLTGDDRFPQYLGWMDAAPEALGFLPEVSAALETLGVELAEPTAADIAALKETYADDWTHAPWIGDSEIRADLRACVPYFSGGDYHLVEPSGVKASWTPDLPVDAWGRLYTGKMSQTHRVGMQAAGYGITLFDLELGLPPAPALYWQIDGLKPWDRSPFGLDPETLLQPAGGTPLGDRELLPGAIAGLDVLALIGEEPDALVADQGWETSGTALHYGEVYPAWSPRPFRTGLTYASTTQTPYAGLEVAPNYRDNLYTDLYAGPNFNFLLDFSDAIPPLVLTPGVEIAIGAKVGLGMETSRDQASEEFLTDVLGYVPSGYKVRDQPVQAPDMDIRSEQTLSYDLSGSLNLGYDAGIVAVSVYAGLGVTLGTQAAAGVVDWQGSYMDLYFSDGPADPRGPCEAAYEVLYDDNGVPTGTTIRWEGSGCHPSLVGYSPSAVSAVQAALAAGPLTPAYTVAGYSQVEASVAGYAFAGMEFELDLWLFSRSWEKEWSWNLFSAATHRTQQGVVARYDEDDWAGHASTDTVEDLAEDDTRWGCVGSACETTVEDLIEQCESELGTAGNDVSPLLVTSDLEGFAGDVTSFSTGVAEKLWESYPVCFDNGGGVQIPLTELEATLEAQPELLLCSYTDAKGTSIFPCVDDPSVNGNMIDALAAHVGCADASGLLLSDLLASDAPSFAEEWVLPGNESAFEEAMACLERAVDPDGIDLLGEFVICDGASGVAEWGEPTPLPEEALFEQDGQTCIVTPPQPGSEEEGALCFEGAEE